MVVGALVAAVAGLLVGSVVGASIDRWIGWRLVLPNLLGYDPPPSALRGSPPQCRECGAALAPFGLPGISWVLSRGRCQGEGRHPIPARYARTELLTAGLWAAVIVKFDVDIVAVPFLVLVTGLVAMSVADYDTMRIPNRFVYATHALLIPSIVVVSIVKGFPRAIEGALLGGVAYFGFLFIFHLVSPRRMGFGDVRLAGVMGLALGWLGWDTSVSWIASSLSWVIYGALIGSVLGTIAGLVALVGRRGSKPFPFGPSLSIGCLVVIFFSSQLGLQ